MSGVYEGTDCKTLSLTRGLHTFYRFVKSGGCGILQPVEDRSLCLYYRID